MYAMKGVMLVSLQYVIFLVIAVYGLVMWKQKVSILSDGQPAARY